MVQNTYMFHSTHSMWMLVPMLIETSQAATVSRMS